MKKYLTLTLAALALLTVSCKKEVAPEVTVPQDEPVATIEKTFTVNAPESGTKTALSGERTVVWSAGDEINVIAPTSGNQYTFTISSGVGESSATFSGEIAASDAGEETFYAIYPNITVRPSETVNAGKSNEKTYKLSDGLLIVDQPITSQTAVKGGFNSSAALMCAASSSNGSFSFNHGSAYFKITIGQDNIKSIRFEVSGSARLGGRPLLVAATGVTEQVNGAKNFMDFTTEGSLENGATYYVPVFTKQSNCGTLTVTATKTDGSKGSVSTTALNNEKLSPGKIYDLKCPTFNFDPIIEADDISVEADATSGSIAYEITNYSGTGTMSAEIKDTSVDWLAVSEVLDDAVNLTVSPNTGSSRYATVSLTYTYAGSKTVTKDITVTQKGASGSSEDYVWDFSSSKWVTEFEKKGKNTDLTNWSISLDGLNWNSVSKSKWNTSTIEEVTYYYIQLGGKSDISKNDRVFSFTTEKAGTVSVKVSNTGSSEATDRKVIVKDSTGATKEAVGGVPSITPTTVNFNNVAAGTIQIYANNGLRFFKIEFHSN